MKYAVGIGLSALVNVALLAGMHWSGRADHRAPAGEVTIKQLGVSQPAPQMKYVRLLSDRRA